MDVCDMPLPQLLPELRGAVSGLKEGEIFSFEAPDPDNGTGLYAGESYMINGRRFIHRGWRNWNDLAVLLGCAMMTPGKISESTVKIRFRRLGRESFHHSPPSGENPAEKYGTSSAFARIRKNEEPVFYCHLAAALGRVGIARRRRILDLGCNRCDLFSAILGLCGPETFAEMSLTGIDHCASALAAAGETFPQANVSLLRLDINEMSAPGTGRFDMILSVGTLQSPSIDTKPLVMRLVQEFLSDDGAILFGFPNARWRDGELIYGASPPHAPFSELSLVVKDLHWIRKYLQQHRFRVNITGREYLFLEAIRLHRPAKPGKQADNRSQRRPAMDGKLFLL
jgi:SAM-dependent methyltransferase